MSCYEIIMALITLIGIIITAIVTNRNTSKQISNANKQNNKPIIFINNIELIATREELKDSNLYFDKYSREKSKNNLENRTIAHGPSTIKVSLSNSGMGIAKDFYIFNKRTGERVKYYVTESVDKWIKKGNVLLIPNGQDNSIEFVPQYIREEVLRDDEEKCSDFCSVLIYYSDINDNYYVLDIKFEIIYVDKKKQFVIKYYLNSIQEANKKYDEKKYKGTDLYKTIYEK